MISDLQMMHEELNVHAGRLTDALGEECPSTIEVAAARWKLSSAARARLTLIQTMILPRLQPLATARDAGDLRTLADEHASVAAELSRHIATWTMERIEEDVSGYRAASQRVGLRLRQQARLEALILMPLLRKHFEISPDHRATTN